MTGDIQLCPCCAAHLRVPDQLHVMRCNSCDAELVFIRQGGVRGLALLPDVVTPYSDPKQRSRHLNGRELLEFRRGIVLQSAARSHALWSGMFFVTLGMLSSAVMLGLAGAGHVASGSREQVEVAALTFLCALTGLPILGYTALYFQGRARLARESVRRWM
jgi:hypothetical protein